MIQPPKKPTKWPQSIRRAAPPVLTVLASAIILSGAVWIHNRQTPATMPASLGAGTAVGLPEGNDTITREHLSNNTPDAPQPQQSGAGAKQSNGNSQPSAQPTPSQSGDIGFLPLSGGTVKSLSDSPLSGGSQASCVVTQYGSAPQTSFGERGLATPNGNDLPLPSGVSNHSLLALSLPSGVLWAVIPSTSMDPVGRPATSSAPTSLYYTPYPANPSSTLATGAITLGQLPVALPGNTSPTSTGWYHPVLNHLSSDKQSIQTGSSGANSAQTDGAPVAPNSGTPENTNSSSSADGMNHLFLQGFYQTSVGAVIALSVNDTSGANDTWLYLWNETDKSLKPITKLQNNHDSFSWFAVGQDVVYWENRHVVPPTYVNFQGEQNIMNVRTLAVTRIHLGTWSSQAVAFGNSLQFQVGQSVQWKEFDPAPGIITSN